MLKEVRSLELKTVHPIFALSSQAAGIFVFGCEVLFSGENGWISDLPSLNV
jgi:hypothetical protein